MKITKKWLKKRNACTSSFKYVCQNNYIGLDVVHFLEKLIKEERLLDANWLVANAMNKKQNVIYAIFTAEQVLAVFEKEYPKDDRPRKAIEAAKKYIKNPCKKTKQNAADAAADAAYAAADAAADAADASDAADAAADAAAYAADAAAYAAADAADAAAYAAAYAAYAAADAAAYAAADLKIKILKYGMRILKKEI